MEPGLLIASPQMVDPYFRNAVILLCRHDEQGAIGLVVNRPLELTVDQALAALNPPKSEPHPETVLWGGPVESGTGFVVLRGALADEGWQLDPELAVSPSRERLFRAISSGETFHLCLGYAGWGAGQLDHEIQSGSWLYAEIDPGIVFDAAIEERYEKALKKLGLVSDQVWMKPVDE
jgi:putative transcriptional regulator